MPVPLFIPGNVIESISLKSICKIATSTNLDLSISLFIFYYMRIQCFFQSFNAKKDPRHWFAAAAEGFVLSHVFLPDSDAALEFNLDLRLSDDDLLDQRSHDPRRGYHMRSIHHPFRQERISLQTRPLHPFRDKGGALLYRSEATQDLYFRYSSAYSAIRAYTRSDWSGSLERS